MTSPPTPSAPLISQRMLAIASALDKLAADMHGRPEAQVIQKLTNGAATLRWLAIEVTDEPRTPA